MTHQPDPVHAVPVLQAEIARLRREVDSLRDSNMYLVAMHSQAESRVAELEVQRDALHEAREE